jgi:hypothetical protein
METKEKHVNPSVYAILGRELEEARDILNNNHPDYILIPERFGIIAAPLPENSHKTQVIAHLRKENNNGSSRYLIQAIGYDTPSSTLNGHRTRHY